MDSHKVDSELQVTAAPFPAEPFPCPECGQMLAASCRVCVACKAPVDFARIGQSVAAPPQGAPEAFAMRAVEPARFSWRIFLVVLSAYLFAAVLTTGLLGNVGSTYAMAGCVLFSSLWVFIDARTKGVPKPMGWAIGCLLMWIVIFPWYLARRRTPLAPCPTIEGEAGPIARAIFYFLMVFILVGALMVALDDPAPK